MMYGPAKSVSGTWRPRLNDKYIHDGIERWYHNGKPHRTDGPAFTAGTQVAWWWYGSHYTFTHWLEMNNELSDEEKVMLKLQYG